MPDTESRTTAEEPAPGAVELREDVPLKSSSWGGPSRSCFSGPRSIVACFAVFSTAITVVLLSQIYNKEYQVIPHGSVSSSSAVCSSSGTDVLKDGGTALDAAIATALCLSVVSPHNTGLDASGAVLVWEYRKSKTQNPLLVEWGGPNSGASKTNVSDLGVRWPKMICALAALHASSDLGTLPWNRLLEPAVNISKSGFQVSLNTVKAAEQTNFLIEGLPVTEGRFIQLLKLSDYLHSLENYTSADVTMHCGGATSLVESELIGSTVGNWRLWIGGQGAGVVKNALQMSLNAITVYNNVTDGLDPVDEAVLAAAKSVHESALGGRTPVGVANGFAVVDRSDIYVSAVTGLSTWFGSGPESPAGWRGDAPSSTPDYSPAVLADHSTCGIRYVIGAESSASLAQSAAALLAGNSLTPLSGVEHSRFSLLPSGELGIQDHVPQPSILLLSKLGPLSNATVPYEAVNLVQQFKDDLTSHADSRGGGLASRFKRDEVTSLITVGGSLHKVVDEYVYQGLGRSKKKKVNLKSDSNE